MDSREYKLMLDPGLFEGARDEAQQAVDRFWQDELIPVITQRLDRRRNGEGRAIGAFELEKSRIVRFWDTSDCALRKAWLSLRERFDQDSGDGPPDRHGWTLKLRSLDPFVAAGSPVDTSADNPDRKLEEDIAPQVEVTVNEKGERTFAPPKSPAIKSIYSRSITVELPADAAFGTVDDTSGVFTGLLDVNGLAVSTNQSLKRVNDRQVAEFVYGKAEVDLGKDADAEFSLTLWYDWDGQRAVAELRAPTLAELSFKYDTKEGDVDPDVAQRALTLFLAMQELEAFNPSSPTKTAWIYTGACD